MAKLEVNTYDEDHQDPTRDYSRVIEFKFEGNILRAKRTDPFGFFKFSLDKGQLPKEYQGFYTDPFEVEKAATAYFQERGKQVTEVLR